MNLTRNSTLSSAKTFVESLAIGWVATEALDWLSVALYERGTDADRRQENEARDHKHAYEVAAEKICSRFGVTLSREELGIWGWRFHKSIGLGSGLLYAMLRKRNPKLGAGNGLAFGALFFFLIDEVMAPLSGFSPGPRAFSWKVHTRGAISHIAYGVAAETAVRVIERIEHSEKSAA